MGHNKNHGAEHTDGTDDIQDATALVKGLATPTQITKLDGIADGADVTGSNPPQSHAHSTHSGIGTDDHHAKSHAHDGVDGSGTIPVIVASIEGNEPSGFSDRTSSSIAFVEGTRTFTITGTDFPIYSKGNRFLRSTESIVIANTTGLHFIYYDETGTLVETTSPPADLFNYALIAIVYWNAATGKGRLGEERHGTVMSSRTHAYLHKTVGVRYESGLGTSFTNTTFSTSQGSIWDEDIEMSILAQTQCRVLYRSGVDFDWTAKQNAYYHTISTVLQYDNSGVLTNVGNNNYVAYWIFGTNDPETPIYSLMGQREDITLANAQANNKYESLVLGTLPFQEMKLLFRVLVRNQAGTPTYIETQDLRGVSNLPAGTYIATDHDTLSGINTDNHHAKSHAHDGVDGSGTVDYSDLTSKPTLFDGAHGSLSGVSSDQHHAKSHAHDGIDGSGTIEGTSVKSTGEAGGVKVLTENGTGGASWQTPSAGDPDAIHDNVANEINAIAASLTPADADVLIAEDANAGTAWSKAKLTMSNLYNYIKAKTDLLYATLSHDHSIGSGGAIATDQVAKFGDGGITDYLEIDTDGQVQLYGAGRIYSKLQFYPYNIGGIAGTYNSIACLAAGLGALNGIYFKSFDDGSGAGDPEAMNVAFMLGTNYVAGSDIEVSFPMAVGGVSTNDVRWQAGRAKISEGETFSPASYVWATPQNIAGPGTAWARKEVTFTLDGTGLVAGDFVSVVVFRDADNAADDYVGDAYAAGLCVKFLKTTLGEE